MDFTHGLVQPPTRQPLQGCLPVANLPQVKSKASQLFTAVEQRLVEQLPNHLEDAMFIICVFFVGCRVKVDVSYLMLIWVDETLGVVGVFFCQNLLAPTL